MCIFCKIIKGEIPSYKIYEDEFTYAFLDIAGDIDGHTLVIPKKHVENTLDCDNQTLHRVIDTVKKISNHYVDDLKFDGVNILNANNEAAEQSVMHLHYHIIPRLKDDKESVWPKLNGAKKSLEENHSSLKMQ